MSDEFVQGRDTHDHDMTYENEQSTVTIPLKEYDKLREKYLSGQPQLDLTGRRKDGHVWPESKIAPYTAHLKGKRKKDAGVDERDKEINKEYYEGR